MPTNPFTLDFVSSALGQARDNLTNFATSLPSFPAANTSLPDFATQAGTPLMFDFMGGNPFNIDLPSFGGEGMLGDSLTSMMNGARDTGTQQRTQAAQAPAQATQSGQVTSIAKPGGPTPSGPLVDYARQAAAHYGIDPDIFVAQINQESGFNANAHSPAGADGVAQFMPGTASAYNVNTKDPYSSLDGAARHMRDLLNQFHGDPRLALAAYNAGAGAVQQYGGIPPYPETQNYVNSIMGSVKHPAAAPAPAQSQQPTQRPNGGAGGGMYTVRDPWGNTFQISGDQLAKRPGGSKDLTIVSGPGQ